MNLSVKDVFLSALVEFYYNNLCSYHTSGPNHKDTHENLLKRCVCYFSQVIHIAMRWQKSNILLQISIVLYDNIILQYSRSSFMNTNKNGNDTFLFFGKLINNIIISQYMKEMGNF